MREGHQRSLQVWFFLATVCASGEGSPPPREPPDSLLAAFTLNSTVPLELYYVDDSNQGKGRLVYIGLASSSSPWDRHALQVLAGRH